MATVTVYQGKVEVAATVTDDGLAALRELAQAEHDYYMACYVPGAKVESEVLATIPRRTRMTLRTMAHRAKKDRLAPAFDGLVIAPPNWRPLIGGLIIRVRESYVPALCQVERLDAGSVLYVKEGEGG